MKVINWLLLLGGGFLAYNFWNNRTNINYNIVGVKLAPARITFQIFNHTNVPVSLKSVNADVLFNGSRIAILSSFGNDPIPANSAKNIDVTVKGDAISFTSAITTILQQGMKNVGIKVIGRIDVNNFNLPVDEFFKII